MPPKPNVKAPAPPCPVKSAEAKKKVDEHKLKRQSTAEAGRRQSLEVREDWKKNANLRKPVKAKGKGKGKGKSKGGKGGHHGAGKHHQEAVHKLEKKIEWKRKSLLEEEYPKPLTKPKFTQVAKLNPDSKGVNLMLKCVKCEEMSNEGGDSGKKFWEAVCGDASGVVTLRIQKDEQAAVCKAGASVRLQNAKCIMTKGFIRCLVDKWAVLKTADAAHDFEANAAKDMSATEYELVQK